MYRVMIVDDEPTALNHIKTILEKRCPDFEVTAMAMNGQEALEKAEKDVPDVVVADISMPVLDGIGLISELKERYPQVRTVLVSGYQEFEYAKSALKYGVEDYFLKPLVPSEIQERFEKISKRLREDYYQRRNECIRKIGRGVHVEEKMLHRYFPSERYYGAIVRTGGLPSRFSGNYGPEVFSDLHEMIFVYGRDEKEALYICPEELFDKKDYRVTMERKIRKEYTDASYVTLVIAGEPFPPEEMSSKIKQFYRVLDRHTVLCKSQTLVLEELLEESATEDRFDTDLLTELDYYASHQQYDRMRKEIRKKLEDWNEQMRPQLWVEGMIRQIFCILQRYDAEFDYSNEFEFLLDDIFLNAESIPGLEENIWEILFRARKNDNLTEKKVNSQESFDVIKDYMNKHMAESLSLQSVSRELGVSQTYLSKLFRKYENTSFNHYLTKIRMEKAKILLRKEGKVFVKDIAEQVGYKDQFYFSRIFRSYVGQCPTDFIEKE